MALPETKSIEEKEAQGSPSLKSFLKTKADARDYSTILKQIKAEHKIAESFIKPKWQQWNIRLKLYNNQKRDGEKVGDPLLFTVFNTVLAALYNDELSVEWEAAEMGDEDVEQNLNLLAKHDYRKMEKDESDYAWMWDSAFFGRGLCGLMEFDRKLMIPIPDVWDVLVTLRDPDAVSVNGDVKGKGSAKYLGRFIQKSERELNTDSNYFSAKDALKSKLEGTSQEAQNIQARNTAQNREDVSSMQSGLLGNNQSAFLLEWYTWYQGKRVLVVTNREISSVHRFQVLKQQDRWPVIDRPIYPMAHDWDGTSIPDLIEDKQRHRAIIHNLSLTMVKAGVLSGYMYDKTRIKNRASLNFEQNRFVPVQGNPTGAIQEIPRANVKQDVAWILAELDAAAQRATATPEMKQGVQARAQRTAKEVGEISQSADTRYSLTAKIFGWSEKRFWRQWYWLYKNHFAKDIDEKILRINGAMGLRWRTLTRDNIVAQVDPDVFIESSVISEAKKMNRMNKLTALRTLAKENPRANVRFLDKRIAKAAGLHNDEIDAFLPPTDDELRARAENESINSGRLPKILATDDDFAHIQIHAGAIDNKQKRAHLFAHEKSIFKKKENPALGNKPIPNEELIAGNKAPQKGSAPKLQLIDQTQ